MNIGGYDLVIDTDLDKTQQRAVMDKYMQSIWKNVEIQIGSNDNPDHDHVFYYRTILAYLSWSEKGRTSRNAKSMVYFIMGDGQCTVVHEGLNEDDVLKVFKGK